MIVNDNFIYYINKFTDLEKSPENLEKVKLTY